ncbi:TPA: NTPase KAP [Campylobacter jejuni]|nr:NTPase KAP [Campylobacter jejuni]HEH4485113.1 NTPase KAP [Campylobacter jejuni]HEH4513617.1 NTPase KAP [Campylobacter jejuni]HEH4530899.1 NTPase KAP [Campylobacter jejuni]HEH5471482.1 NTPase KAP [Campylobacter coli]
MDIIAVLYYISSVIILFCSFVVEKCKKEKIVDENYKVAKVSKYLTTKEKQCLAILGAWGVGKTYFWKQIEKEITLNFDNKKVIYVDLFGKENYKQILEEIILKLHGNYNKIINIFAQITFRIAKFKSAGIADINPGTIFSCLKKNDFKNIIVCFDNIERRSDNLPLKEILGLINLLKEDKECSVVLILNKNELNKQEDNAKNNMQTSSNDKTQHDAKQNNNDWYQEYKEKVIDYEMLLENNDEIAKALIEEAFMQDEKFIQDDDLKSNLVDIVLKHYQDICDSNLRLLLKILEHIKYFNIRCFKSHYDKTIKEEFIIVIDKCYFAIFNAVKDFYIQQKEKRNLSNMYIYDIVTRYLNNFFIINDNDEKKLNKMIIDSITVETKTNIKGIYKAYTEQGDSDIDFKNKLEELSDKIYKQRKYFWNFFIETYDKELLEMIYVYKDITDKDLSIKDLVVKAFIVNFKRKEDDPSLSELLTKYPTYDKFSSKIKKTNKPSRIITTNHNFVYDRSSNTFELSKIDDFNNYNLDLIVKSFHNDKYFFQDFMFFYYEIDFKYFILYAIEEYIHNAYIKKIEEDNQLFRAFICFINKDENRIKKQSLIKKYNIKENQNTILSKLFFPKDNK